MNRREKVIMTVGQLIAAGMIAIGAVLYAESGECTMCPTFECYGKCYTPDCVCMSQPGEVSGQCYGVGVADDMVQMGWVRN